MKTIISILLLLTSISCFGQFHNVKEVRFVPRTDSVTTSNIGKIAFDADDDKLRFNDGTGWYSYLRDDATLSFWPLNGSASVTNSDISFSSSGTNTIHVAPDTFAIDLSAIGGLSGVRLSSFIDPFGEERAHMSLSAASIVGGDSIRFSFVSGIDNTQAVFRDWRGAKRGILYAEYDSTDWTDSTLVTKAYVDGSIAEGVAGGAFMPLTGTADLTGNTVIDGNNFDLTFGSTNALDDFGVIADNSADISYLSGNTRNRLRAAGGATSMSATTDAGTTVSQIIVQQTGSGDDIQIIAGNSTVFVIEADGDIRTPSLPTDCTGKSTGTWWNDSGAVKLCP